MLMTASETSGQGLLASLSIGAQLDAGFSMNHGVTNGPARHGFPARASAADARDGVFV